MQGQGADKGGVEHGGHVQTRATLEPPSISPPPLPFPPPFSCDQRLPMASLHALPRNVLAITVQPTDQ